MISIDKNGIKIITGKAFRLVWMANQYITTIEGTAKSKTWTKQEVEELTTAKLAEDRIKELDLEVAEHNKATETTKTDCVQTPMYILSLRAG